ncbi:S8 family peptidase [Halomonas sp. ATCH28]|uniref:S8 family peptidase n=1 Tax=Halomonas gemina TaxID=2945105 RepID=A0ABT0SXA2_9GAMM|nr:S8 family peptidase [Halomonas gemina]MCL7938780.1 S8 family peptidase [Halomonas gemina]
MANKQRFLFGRGEKLTDTVRYRGGYNESDPLYDLGFQKDRFKSYFETISSQLEEIPDDKLAGGNAVIGITLHPKYISRSAFPEGLINQLNLRLLGSRSTKIKPIKGKGSDDENGALSTFLFLSGKKEVIQSLGEKLSSIENGTALAEDFLKLEAATLPNRNEKMAGNFSNENESVEVVLHFDSAKDVSWEPSFVDFAGKHNIDLGMSRSYQSRGLLFIPARGGRSDVEELADFSFIRMIRPMPKLRTIDEPTLIKAQHFDSAASFPTTPPLDESYRVAIFDGGLPPEHPYGRWVNYIEPSDGANIGGPINNFVNHGALVTSAFLFGHVEPGNLERPYASVDHYRVLGDGLTDSSLYDVLIYIDEVLSQSNYPIISFSIGPHEVAGDDVTAWTAMLDDHLGSGQCLGGIAVGNDGEEPWPKSRIQVPSDCVNALSVGATDSMTEGWMRAPYSSIGPGRNPGLIKPDVVAFGGVEGNAFHFISPQLSIVESRGTSFSTPYAMRIAAGLKSYLGSDLTPTAIRALMVHSASSSSHSIDEVGWGMVSDVVETITCKDGEIKVLYKGRLEPGKVMRAPIPLPDEQLRGNVEICATFCYTCNTDPHTPGEYTRAGLDIRFRPHKGKFKKTEARIKKEGKGRIDPQFPDTESFFTKQEFASEADLRTDGHKWDTVRKNSIRKRGSSLDRPVFDIHYIAREPGNNAAPQEAEKIHFALVVSVYNKNTPDLYEKVQEKYITTLLPIEPKIEVPVQIST